MASRTSSAARYIVDEVASPEATKRLFGIDDQRAATLSRWVAEALQAQAAPEAESQDVASSKRAKAARQASKRLRKAGPKKASAKQ